MAQGATRVGSFENLRRCAFTLAEGATHVGSFAKKRLVAFTLAEGATHVGSFKNLRRCAFTLAEVLITLSIIGVVASLTIPDLIASNNEQQTVTKVKKAYSSLSQALDMMVIDYGEPKNWGLVTTNTGTTDEEGNPIYDYSSQEWFAKIFSQYMKVSKKCWEEGVDCSGYGDSYYLNGTKHGTNNISPTSSQYSFVLVDGTIVMSGWTNPSGVGNILVMFPNNGKDMYIGKDIFFYLYTGTGKLIPEGSNEEGNNGFKSTCVVTGRGCTAWVVYNGNMDYLHCPEDLSWNGNHKCP